MSEKRNRDSSQIGVIRATASVWVPMWLWFLQDRNPWGCPVFVDLNLGMVYWLNGCMDHMVNGTAV